MKIAGLSDLRYRAKFRFNTVTRADGTPLELDLVALPYGFEADLNAEIGMRPTPPKRIVGKGEGGIPFWRDCDDDPEFLKALALWTALSNTAVVFLSLAFDTSITWETPAELRKSDPKAYWTAIAGEIKASGWPSLEVGRLIKQCTEMADVSAEGVEAAKQSFLATSG